MEPLRANFIHLLQLLASRELQDRYRSEVDGEIGDELMCMWFDSFYHPDEQKRIQALLSDEETQTVEEFHAFISQRYDLIPQEYDAMRESPVWREVMAKALNTLKKLKWDEVQTVWGFGAV